VIDQIVSESTIKYPPQMLEEEMHQLLHSLEDDLGRQHMDIPTYLKTLNTTQEKFLEEQIKPAAQRRLMRSLALDQFADKEKISLNKEEFDSEVQEMLGELEKMPDSRKQSKAERKNLVGLVQLETANRLINRQIMDRLKQIATGAFVPAEATAEEKTDAESVSSEEKSES
jgi:trigger factor